MSDDKSPFADFDFDNLQVGGEPGGPAPAINPAAEPPPMERPKRGRKPKAPAAETKPKAVRKTRGPRRQLALVTDAQIAAAAAQKGSDTLARHLVADAKTRKPRTPKTDHKPIKLDLATAMQVAATLRDGDGALFQKMVQALSGLNKASRDRILAALGKVFA